MADGYGKLVPAGDAEEMSEAILQFSRMDLSSVKSAVRSVAESTFSWEANVKRLAETYEELI